MSGVAAPGGLPHLPGQAGAVPDQVSSVTCDCTLAHEPVRVVLTGGPGAGKTAVLEMVRHTFCQHVRVLPEAAGVVFGGGFPRGDDPPCRRAAQRAIFQVERELEACADAHRPAVVVCDRGTVDGLAYWVGHVDDLWSAVGSSLEKEMARYRTVIHLRTPAPDQGYNHRNPLRLESATRAAEIDARILSVWATHPNRLVVAATPRFLEKANTALDILRAEIPDCCGRQLAWNAGGA